MKTWLLVSVGIFFLYGCAEVKYVKAGATEADLDADKVACHDQMIMSSSGADLARATMSSPGVRGVATQTAGASARQDVDQCLRSKGWVLETQDK